MIALLAALLIRTPPPPSIVGLRLDRLTHCVEVWRSGELIAEYEPRDGAIYAELLGILDDAPRPFARYPRPQEIVARNLGKS